MNVCGIANVGEEELRRLGVMRVESSSESESSSSFVRFTAKQKEIVIKFLGYDTKNDKGL